MNPAVAMTAWQDARSSRKPAALGGLKTRLPSVRLSPGLGILRRVIVDQHFRERDRIGRLMATVVRNPSMLGFGVAAVYGPGTNILLAAHEVLGIIRDRGKAA